LHISNILYEYNFLKFFNQTDAISKYDIFPYVERANLFYL
jgi:hypothetical protein